jgi:hypothetical protein
MASVATTTRPSGSTPTAINSTQPTPIDQHRQRSIQSGRIAIKPGSPVLMDLPTSNFRLGTPLEPSHHIPGII